MAFPGIKKNKAAGENPAPSKSSLSANRGVFSFMLIPIVALVLAVAASAWWVIDKTIGPVNQRHQAVLVEQVAEQYEAYFNNVLSQHQSLMERLANSREVVDRLVQGDQTGLSATERRIANQVPHGLAVHLFPTGAAETQPNTTPPLGFAGLDMIRRTEQGQSLPWEAHQADGQPYLHAVTAVRDANGNLVGTLSVSQSMDYLQQELAGIDGNQGNVIVRQQFQNGPQQTLLTYGAKNSNDVITLRSDNPNWTLTFQPSDELTQSTVFSASSLWAAFGLILVAGLVTIALAAQRLQAALRHDGNLFARHVQRLMAGQSSEPQAYSLAIFNSVAKGLSRMRMGKSQARGASPAPGPAPSRSAPAAPATQAPPETEDMDDFDVTMMEGDNDILGMDAPVSPQPQTYTTAVSPDIFRAYDIRGILGETLDADVARQIGLAVGSEAYDRGDQTVIVGRDGRLSSPELTKALIAGLTGSGRDVIDIGVVPTPLAYYATQSLGATSCVMVTGSHNPGNYNGFKVVLGGNALTGDEIQRLRDRIENEQFLSGSGNVSTNEIAPNYINRVVEDVKVARPMKVVVDCGNGVAGGVVPKLIKSLGCHVLPLYCDIDGNFPNHHPDPGDPNNLQDLARTVVETRADIGLAFDGDGDRIGLVTNSGKIINADRLLMLLAKDMITRNPGATVIYDVKCSRRLHGLIVGYGGKPLMWKTGHSHIKRKMKESGALLGGEMSGHIYYKERWYGFDDALYTAARLLEIVSKNSDSLDALFGAFPEDTSTPELTIATPEDRKFGIIERLQRESRFEGGKITDIDGVRVDFPDGWGLVRASNTSSKLVCRFEADTDHALNRIQAEFRSQLQAVDSQLQIPF